MCDEIRLALAEVRRRTPSAEPAWGPRGTTPRLTVRGTAAGAPPPPPPPPPYCLGAVGCGQWSECPAGPVGMLNRAHQPAGTGSLAQGVVGLSCRACGEVEPGPPAWGDGESCPVGGRSLLQGPWGGVTFGEPGPPACGGRGVQPRGWSEPPLRPMGRPLLRRTGPTGLGGTGSPAHGVVGASFKAHGEASSSENRAHRPGGDGESSPGGGRSLL